MSDSHEWCVAFPDGKSENVTAEGMKIEHGVIIFLDADNNITLAYAPNSWKNVVYLGTAEEYE
jgi:hypothetical protein